MSKLPFADEAVIDERKITGYLLAESHAAGWAKAVFFRRLGFRIAAWPVLRKALLDHARVTDIAKTIETEFGRKYILLGTLAAPNGSTPLIQTVWFAEFDERLPRFVTAYPAREQER
jgi:hypothetical protein